MTSTTGSSLVMGPFIWGLMGLIPCAALCVKANVCALEILLLGSEDQTLVLPRVSKPMFVHLGWNHPLHSPEPSRLCLSYGKFAFVRNF